jgi:flagellar L-ring protein precursor FlgH
LITIIVRERRTFKAQANLKTKKEFDLTSELEAFIKLTDGGIGSAAFRRGQPNIDYELEQEFRGKGDAKREDRLTTRLTGKIIDVKPNGVLVLEAQARVKHDDEVSVITFTGNCRKQDVTPDNTILSTQVAQKNIVVSTEGALRSVSSRGWLLKLLDQVNPF